MSIKYSFSLCRNFDSVLTKEQANHQIKTFLSEFVGLTIVKSNWKVTVSPEINIIHDNGGCIVEKTFYITRVSGTVSTEVRQKENILKSFKLMCENHKYGTNPWSFSENQVIKDVVRISTVKSDLIAKESNQTSIAKLSIDHKSNHFDHLYDRDHQIKMVLSAIEAANESNFENRFHCLLHGEPACGKSDILISIGNMLGKEDEAYMKLDATSTTMAGAQKKFLDPNIKLPNILLIEEIEKQKEDHFRWLLALLDARAEIRKDTARESYKRSHKMLCLATVNNMDLFKRQMSGALHSRFSNKIYCPRPDRKILEKILSREIEKSNGKKEWIEPALKFCVDKMGWNDPREIIPVCLQGRDGLLDGSYQESILATQEPKAA